MTLNTPLLRILDIARWAPSGDNTQPWRFQIIDDSSFNIITHDTRDWCVYDLDGKSSILAVGALLENIEIAASTEGFDARFEILEQTAPESLTITVTLTENTSLKPDPLAQFIPTRVTQRRPLLPQPLTESQKQALESSVGDNYKILWAEDKKRKQMAGFLFKSSQIYLTIPECYEVHKRIIDWNAQFSEDKIPDKAVGLDPIAIKLMQWAVKKWKRVEFLNRYLAGTLLPRLQLSFLPGLKCAAHFVIVANKPIETADDYLEGGRALQRFWLTAASLDLFLQPEMASMIFSRYVLVSKNFTRDQKAMEIAKTLPAKLQEIFGRHDGEKRVFMGRLGAGKTPTSRSVRLPLTSLIIK